MRGKEKFLILISIMEIRRRYLKRISLSFFSNLFNVAYRGYNRDALVFVFAAPYITAERCKFRKDEYRNGYIRYKNEQNSNRHKIDETLEKYPRNISVSAYVCMFSQFILYIFIIVWSVNLQLYKMYPHIKVLLNSMHTYIIYMYVYGYVYVWVCIYAFIKVYMPQNKWIFRVWFPTLYGIFYDSVKEKSRNEEIRNLR